MTEITLKGNPVHTVGALPQVGTQAPDFVLVGTDLTEIRLTDFRGSKVVLNIFPSVDTGICAMSVRTFNQEAANFDGVNILCISKDLPFAQARFCGAEGIDKVISASAFRSSFGEDYGITFEDGPLTGLLSRSVLVLDEEGKVIYSQQVAETATEPDYQAAIAAL